MIDNSAEGFLPAERSLATLAKAVQGCQGCDLYLNATHAVFGEGPAHARAMLIGEQPGDREDVEGHPFVGRPAGSSIARWGKRGSTVPTST
jgi:uracil-DNA glycosylase